MADRDIPPGWTHNPSAWRRRLPVLLLALIGCAIATYLTLYQVYVIPRVWEPFFGKGSSVILRQSSIAHLLPIPDAALGACMYLLEAVVDSLGGTDRWRSRPWIVVLLGLIGAALGVTGIVLAVCQPVLFHAFCTPCLTSAACSILIAALAADEVLATLAYLRRAAADGRSVWRVLWGIADGQVRA